MVITIVKESGTRIRLIEPNSEVVIEQTPGGARIYADTDLNTEGHSWLVSSPNITKVLIDKDGGR